MTWLCSPTLIAGLAHANFDITKEIKSRLNKTEGVELLKVLSRYRFFVGVGKMFDFKQVRKEY